MTPALKAQELVKEGDSAYKKGDYINSAKTYRAAAEAYRVSGDELLAAKMLNNCSVTYLQAGDAQRALEVVEGTSEIFESLGDLHHQAMAIGNRAAALEELERFDEAEQLYLKSAKILQEIGEYNDRLHVLQSLSAMQLRMGRRLEAYASMYAAVNTIEHPNPRQRLLKTLMEIPFKIFNKS